MQDLFAATGLQPGSLYNAFGSKAGLFEEALRYYSERELASIREQINSCSNGLAGLCNLLTGAAKVCSSGDFASCFLVKSQLELAANGDENLKQLVKEQLDSIYMCINQALMSSTPPHELKGRTDSVYMHFMALKVVGYQHKDYEQILSCLAIGLPWLPWAEQPSKTTDVLRAEAG
jgi:TetR/AcrR family transcriptional repressor of nem operon